MTAARAVRLTATDTERGCARCGTQRTVQLHPAHGRLCSDHATLPVGSYRQGLADDMVDFGRADAAFAHLGAWLAREVDDRFAAAARRLQPVTA